jgi:hypothetical protein
VVWNPASGGNLQEDEDKGKKIIVRKGKIGRKDGFVDRTDTGVESWPSLHIVIYWLFSLRNGTLDATLIKRPVFWCRAACQLGPC